MEVLILQAVSFQNASQIDRIVLFLHGYGANGEDLINIGRYWDADLPGTLFIAPNAPYVHPYLQNGYMWFPFKDISNITLDDIKNGLLAIRPVIHNYIDELSKIHKVPTYQIIPVGFSQGGMIALDTLVTCHQMKVAICYAGSYYPFKNELDAGVKKHALLVHGLEDSVVRYHYMKDAEAELIKLGVYVKSVTCAGVGHSISQEGILAGVNFLKEWS